MRHRRKIAKLQRAADQRRALLANLVCSLIEQRRVKTTLAKAKALRPVAEKMVTLGKRGTLHARRQAFAYLRHKPIVSKLFDEIAPASENRQGGYTRITRLGQRPSDAAPMAYIEWVDVLFSQKEEETPEKETAATPASASKKGDQAEKKT